MLIAAAAAGLVWRSARPERVEEPAGRLPALRRVHLLVALGVLLVATALLVARGHEKTTAEPARGATTARLGSIESNRYAYWRVAGHMFVSHPLRGEGSGSFGVEWLQRRKIPEAAQDAHSLYIETAGELGLVGLAALALFLAGAAVAARRAFGRNPSLTAGWIAGRLGLARARRPRLGLGDARAVADRDRAGRRADSPGRRPSGRQRDVGGGASASTRATAA